MSFHRFFVRGHRSSSPVNLFFEILNKTADILPLDDVLIANCILFAVITVVYSTGRLLYVYLSARVAGKIVREYEQKVFRKYMDTDYHFFVNNKQGDLIYRGSQAPQFIGITVISLTRAIVEIILTIFVFLLLI